MCPCENKIQRKKYNPAIWKSEVYNALPHTLYVESSVKQAEIIAEKTGKTVYCIDNSLIYNNTLV
jgi:hypothetical protein